MLGIVEKRAPVFESGEGEWDDERICAAFGLERLLTCRCLKSLKVDLKASMPQFCTSAESNMGKVACELRGVEVIRITERENGLADETIAVLRSHIERLCRLTVNVLIWSSIPCTGGCTCLSENVEVCVYPPDLSDRNSTLVNQPKGATMHDSCLDNAAVLHQEVLCSLPMPILARLRPLNGKERVQASNRHAFNFSTENLEPREKLPLNPPEPSKMAGVSFSLPMDVLPRHLKSVDATEATHIVRALT